MTTLGPVRQRRPWLSTVSLATLFGGTLTIGIAFTTSCRSSNRHSCGALKQPRWHNPRFRPLGLIQHLPLAATVRTPASLDGQVSDNPKQDLPVASVR
jgi:hypothetical protein